MENKNIDALIASSPENVFYISGFGYCQRSLKRNVFVSAVVVKEEEPTLIAPKSEQGTVLYYDPWIKDRRYFGKFPVEGETEPITYRNMIGGITQILKEKKLVHGRIGIEKEYIPWAVFEKMRKIFPSVTFVNATKFFEELRMTKSNDQIAKIKEVLRIHEKALRYMLQNAKKGITEEEACALMQRLVTDEGAEVKFLDVGAGIRTIFPCLPTQNKLKKGDIFRIDFGLMKEHYCSDICRTAVVGEPNPEQKHVHEAIALAENKIIEAVRPGIRTSQLFDIGIESMKTSGFPSYKRHHLGHGIGLEAHEPPVIGPENGTILKPRMVLCVEVPYYKINFGGMNLEDTILVTEKKCEILSRSNRELFEI